MNKYVLDTSVSMRWLLASQQMEDQKYAEDILFSLSNAKALVPQLWYLGVTIVLITAGKRKEVEIA